MFEYLREFKRIFVTGPQRSGTTICAIMIAKDLGYKWYKEHILKDMYPEQLKKFAQANKNFVLQCPTMCAYIHEIASHKDAVVFMRRPLREILESQKRIGWDKNDAELKRYGLDEGIIAKVKYDRWQFHQKALIVNPFEVHYRSLSKHPLWVPKKLRQGWKARQTSPYSKFTWDDSEQHKKIMQERKKRGRAV